MPEEALDCVTPEMVYAERIRRHPVRLAAALSDRYKPAWFHWLIGDELRNVATGGVNRLIINVPPRHGKSWLCSRVFPPWFLGVRDFNGDPRSIISSSYNASLARSFGRAARNITTHPVYRYVFGTSVDKAYGAAAHDWALTNGNTFACAGVGGGITGLGARVFNVDDPIKDRRQADSAMWRENLKDWFREVALTRLSPDGAIVIVMTRWHYDDLVGWLLRESEDKWCLIKLPALQTDDARPYDKREPGQALWPERYSAAYLHDIERDMGVEAFNCIYQQDPQPAGAAVLDVASFVFDFMLDELPVFVRIVESWDTAFEEKRGADFSVGQVWGDTGKDYYLVDQVRGQMRFPKLRKAMIELHNKWNGDAVLVEAKASGKDVVYELRDSTNLPLIPIEPQDDKVQRAAAVAGRIEAGRVHLPKHAPWLRDLLTELKHFPKAAHDDQVDALTQAIRWMSRFGSKIADVM
jgi:predicted phage terminase large subunit-like protein